MCGLPQKVCNSRELGNYHLLVALIPLTLQAERNCMQFAKSPLHLGRGESQINTVSSHRAPQHLVLFLDICLRSFTVSS